MIYPTKLLAIYIYRIEESLTRTFKNKYQPINTTAEWQNNK